MKKSPKTRVLLLGVSSLCMLTVPQFAFANTTSSNTNNADLFPLTPRISGLGLAGTNEVVAGDAMAALVGNENGIWWLDGQGKTAFESAWVGSVGTGFRVVQDNKRILGAYVFGDRNISGNNTDFWFVSPGVESLGQVFDFRVNGYIPVSDQHKLTGTGFADTFGNYDYVKFQGHQQLDAIVDNYEMTGWGVDGEVGVKLPGWHGTRVYVGGYHFDQDQADAINGVAARVEYPINQHLALNVRDSYDNTQHNTIEVGLQVNIGGVNKNPRERDQAIRERLLDPVSRNLATLGQGTAEPIGNEQVVVNNGNDPNPPLEVERDNIWFFSPTGTDTFTDATSCTAENVCVDTNLTQATIDGINAGPTGGTIIDEPSASPSFYLAEGTTYNFNTDGTPFTLTDDFFYGRSSNFVMDEQVTVQGAAILNGTDILSYLTFQYDPAFRQTQQVGLTLNPNSDVTLTRTIIGADNITRGYFTGISMSDATLTTNTNSEIHAFNGDPNNAPIGIDTNDTTTSIINLTDTLVNSTGALSVAGSNPYAVYGIKTDNVTGANITLNDSTVSAKVSTQGAAVTGDITVDGIATLHTSGTSSANDSISLSSDSTINSNANSNGENITVNGIYFGLANSSTLTLDNSQINATLAGNINRSGNVYGINMNGLADTVNINNNSKINVSNNANGGNVQLMGLKISAAGLVTVGVQNSFITAVETTTSGNDNSNTQGILVNNEMGAGDNTNITIGTGSIIDVSQTADHISNQADVGAVSVVGSDIANVNVTGGSTLKSNLAITGTPVTAASGADSRGIFIFDANTTTVNLSGGSTIDVDGTAAEVAPTVVGILADDVTTVNVNVSGGSKIFADVTSPAVSPKGVNGSAVGGIAVNGATTTNILVSGGSTITANSILNATSSGIVSTTAAGIIISDPTDNAVSKINVNGSTVSANVTASLGGDLEAYAVSIISDDASDASNNLTNNIILQGATLKADVTAKDGSGGVINAIGAFMLTSGDNITNTIDVNGGSITSNVTADQARDTQSGAVVIANGGDTATTNVTNTVKLEGTTLNATSTVNKASPDSTFTVADVIIASPIGDNTVTSSNSTLKATNNLGETGSNIVELRTTNIFSPAPTLGDIDISVSGGTLTAESFITNANSSELTVYNFNLGAISNSSSGNINVAVSAATLDSKINLDEAGSSLIDLFANNINVTGMSNNSTDVSVTDGTLMTSINIKDAGTATIVLQAANVALISMAGTLNTVITDSTLSDNVDIAKAEFATIEAYESGVISLGNAVNNVVIDSASSISLDAKIDPAAPNATLEQYGSFVTPTGTNDNDGSFSGTFNGNWSSVTSAKIN